MSLSFSSAFRADVTPSTGGWRDERETVRRKVSALTRDFRSMWIGIASQGANGVQGRWNAKYKDLGMKNIAIVYLTTSDSFRKNLEDDLTDFYGLKSNGGLLDNEVLGGGGGYGSPPYAVYVAWA